jgi:tetratricopeptide (TPR) repeat protein
MVYGLINMMMWHRLIFLGSLMALGVSASGQGDDDALTHQHWFETRTAHFNVYSCGTPQEVYRVAGQLEQFREAYGLLAGAHAVASPPVIVMAFPNLEAMQPFLPQYQGKPANLAGFFRPGTDENLIVLALSGTNSRAMSTIFHEYDHLLMRGNDPVWPAWLQEGMAEMYSTFEATGRGVTIGKPIEHHLRLLAQSSFMPLRDLLAVTHDSPDYNESDRQGVFYAESWLLTHFLMNGDDPVLKKRFGDFTTLLWRGQSQVEAFTNAMRVPLPVIEAELHHYLERGELQSIGYVVSVDLSTPRAVATRDLGRAETCFRLGIELMRIGRLDACEPYFLLAKSLAPKSPLPYEGLGLLARERDQPEAAVKELKESIQLGSISFLAYYAYAQQRLHLLGDAQGRYGRIEAGAAADIRAALDRAVGIMPSFGPAHELLGFLDLVQGEDLASAQQHLERAIQLEPQNQWYLLSLAQVQMRTQDDAAARLTLEPLRRLRNVEPKLRAQADELMSEIDREEARKTSH